MLQLCDNYMYNFRLFDAVTGADQCDAKNAGTEHHGFYFFSSF